MRRRRRGKTIKEDLSRGWPGRGGFGMFGMLGTPCRQPHQQQKQRHDDGSQTPDLGDSRGYALRGLCGPPEQSNSGRIILNACGGESFTTALRVGASPSQLQQVTVTQCGAVRPQGSSIVAAAQ